MSRFWKIAPAFLWCLLIATTGSLWAESYLSLGDTRLDFQGYFRSRYYFFRLEGPDTSLGDMRLRLETRWTLAKDILLNTQLDGLENVVWGRNDGFTNLLTKRPGTESHGRPLAWLEYEKGKSFSLSRVWAEVDLPFGYFKFGRMPLEWGLGVYVNPGISEDNDYGDTADRIAFRTLPLGGDYSPLTAGFAWSRISTGNSAFSNLNQNEFQADLLFKQEITEAGLLAAYRNQGSGPNRDTPLGNTNIAIIDAFAHQKIGPFYLEAEGMWVHSVFDLSTQPFGGTQSFQDVKGKSWAGLGRAGVDMSRARLAFEYGFQAGADRNQLRVDQSRLGWTGSTFGLYGWAPDTTVDMIMFREYLAAVTRASVSPFDDTLGGVLNAQYLKLAGAFDLTEHVQLRASGIWGELMETAIFETFGDSYAAHRSLGFELNGEAWYFRKAGPGTFKAGLQVAGFQPGKFFDDLPVYNGDDGSRTGGITWFTNDPVFSFQTKLLYSF